MLPSSFKALEKSHSAPLLEEEKFQKVSAGPLSPLSMPCSLPSSPSSSRTWSCYVPNLRRFNPLYLFSNISNDKPPLEVNLSQLKILEAAETQKTLDLFKKFYGDELVEGVLARYKINRPLSPILATVLIYGIGAAIREETLVQFYQKLREQKIPLEDFLKLGLTEEIFAALCSLAETTPYEQLDDEQIDLLMSALQGPLLQSQITDEQSKGMIKELVDLDAAQAFQSDYQIFRRCTQQQEFNSKNYPESAQSEFWSRKPPYAALKAGMLIAGRNLETDRPIYYKVINGIDKEGFGVFLLQGAAPQNHNKVMMLFRGTDPSNIESLRGNLGRASGLDPFLKEEANIQGMFLSLCEVVPGPIQLSVHGHSQGGALSQHFIHSLTRDMAAQAGKETPLQKIKTIEMCTWEAPAVLEEQAREFCESMLALSRHVDTMHVRASLNYHQVDKDLVVRCGEVFLGRFRKSYNFDCKVLTFPLNALMPLDKHCTPIHNQAKDAIPVRVITFDCSYAQEMQRKAELLLVYAAQLQNRALLLNLKNGLKSAAAVEYLDRAEKLRDVDELQKMLNETKNGSELKECQDEEIRQLETGLNLLLRAQKLLHHDRPHINRIKAIYPEWLAEIERFMQQKGSVQEYLKAYEERIEDVDKALQKEGEILALALQDTAFSNLSTTDKIVAGSLLDYVKTLTFEITGDELSTSEKVKRGLLTVSASSLAAAGAYTAATVILANPVTAASVVTLAGAGAVLYNGTKYVYNKTSSYFSPLK